MSRRYYTFIKEAPVGKGAHPQVVPGTIGQFAAVTIAGWRKVDGRPVDHLEPRVRQEAIEVLRAAFRRNHQEIARAMENPMWHLQGGMTVRNTLRAAGYGEVRMGVANLDDVYQDLAREAIRLGPRPVTRRLAGLYRLLKRWGLRRLAARLDRWRSRLPPSPGPYRLTAAEPPPIGPPPPPPLTGDEPEDPPRPPRPRFGS